MDINLKQIINIDTIIEIHNFFNNDLDKAALWFHTPNDAMFGGLTPKEYAGLVGKERFHYIVMQAIEGVKP